MTDKQKDTINRWLPTVLQIAAFLVVGGIAYGRISTQLDSVKELQKLNREDIRELRQHINKTAGTIHAGQGWTITETRAAP